jgi:hypothetical protein
MLESPHYPLRFVLTPHMSSSGVGCGILRLVLQLKN